VGEAETLRYFAQVAEKLEGIAQELAVMKRENGEVAGHLHRLAEAIREDMSVSGDLEIFECRWSMTDTTRPATITRRGP